MLRCAKPFDSSAKLIDRTDAVLANSPNSCAKPFNLKVLSRFELSDFRVLESKIETLNSRFSKAVRWITVGDRSNCHLPNAIQKLVKVQLGRLPILQKNMMACNGDTIMVLKIKRLVCPLNKFIEHCLASPEAC